MRQKRRSPGVQARASGNEFNYQEENVMSNNSTAVLNVAPETVPAIAYAGRPVVTTALLAKLYGTDDHNIIKNYKGNEARFVAGKHFHKLEGHKLREFKDKVTQSDVVQKRARHLILWTERGAARHAKMLDTDQAWDVFERLEDCYFASTERAVPQLEHVGLTPAQQRHVQNRVAELANGERVKFAKIYRSIKDRFMVGSYKDVPASEYPKLCVMLMCQPLEGEWIGRQETSPALDLCVWSNISCLVSVVEEAYQVFDKYRLYHHLSGLGSPAGAELLGLLQDGSGSARSVAKQCSTQFAEVRAYFDKAKRLPRAA